MIFKAFERGREYDVTHGEEKQRISNVIEMILNRGVGMQNAMIGIQEDTFRNRLNLPLGSYVSVLAVCQRSLSSTLSLSLSLALAVSFLHPVYVYLSPSLPLEKTHR